MPHPSFDSFFFWNSGSEAVEGAVKLARTKTGKQNVIVMQGKNILLLALRGMGELKPQPGAYHGRTYGAMALTRSKTVYAKGVHPLIVGHRSRLSPTSTMLTLVQML